MNDGLANFGLSWRFFGWSEWVMKLWMIQKCPKHVSSVIDAGLWQTGWHSTTDGKVWGTGKLDKLRYWDAVQNWVGERYRKLWKMMINHQIWGYPIFRCRQVLCTLPRCTNVLRQVCNAVEMKDLLWISRRWHAGIIRTIVCMHVCMNECMLQ